MIDIPRDLHYVVIGIPQTDSIVTDSLGMVQATGCVAGCYQVSSCLDSLEEVHGCHCYLLGKVVLRAPVESEEDPGRQN